MICKDEKITINGITWYFQKFVEGGKTEYNLYDEEGNFVAEFKDFEEMIRFVM